MAAFLSFSLETQNATTRAGERLAVEGRRIRLLTVVGDGLGSPLVAVVVRALLVLGLPGVVDLQAAVELLPAGGEQLDVCAPGTQRKDQVGSDTNLCRY